MAENPKFNNSDMFTDVTNNTGYTDIDADNKSEVLATQGNVINSIKVFWNKLRAKLVYAITRGDITKAYGDDRHPVYVNSNGIVEVCNPKFLTGSVTNNNINLDEINPLYPGQIVCIKVTNNSTNNTSFLKINNTDVYYPTNVQVKVSDISNNTTYLFTYISGDGNKWILNNKINVVSTDNSGLMTAAQCSKLEGIADGANNYKLPTADTNTTGGVKLGYTTNGKNYGVQKDSNDKLFVNVPWTDNNTHLRADLKVGTSTSQSNDTTTSSQDTYIKIVENSDVRDSVKVVGSNGIKISSSSNGDLEITGTQNEILNTNSSSGGWLVPAPSRGQHTNLYFLAGDGTWVKVTSVPASSPIDSGKILKCDSEGKPYWADA